MFVWVEEFFEFGNSGFDREEPAVVQEERVAGDTGLGEVVGWRMFLMEDRNTRKQFIPGSHSMERMEARLS